MSTMYITEYKTLAVNNVGGAIQAGQEPALENKDKAFTTTTQSDAFNKETVLIRITCDAEAFLKFGENPTATATGTQVQADTPEFFGVEGGHKVAAVEA